MKQPEYLKNPKTGNVLAFTTVLAERGDLIPCDADGCPLNEDYVMPLANQVKIPSVIHSVVNGRGLGNPEKRKQSDEKLNNEIHSAIKKSVRRKSLRYDGVMGELPEWVPQRERRRFIWERNLLLNNYSHDQVLELLKMWPEAHLFSEIHRELVQAVDYLVYVKKATDAGEYGGIKMLCGDYAARGYSNKACTELGARNSHKKQEQSTIFCVEEAATWWSKEESGSEEITRIGKVCDVLWGRLANEGLWRPKTSGKVKGWLKAAEKKGELIIPAEAKKPGRPRS